MAKAADMNDNLTKIVKHIRALRGQKKIRANSRDTWRKNH